jgi:hypothetical protein
MLSSVHLLFIPADSSNMCAQTIFSLLDHLSAWAVGKNKAAAVRRLKHLTQKGLIKREALARLGLRPDVIISPGNPQEISNVSSYLEGIPKVSRY